MMHAGIVGLGRWGRILVDAVQGRSEVIRVTAGCTGRKERAQHYCDHNGIDLRDSLDQLLVDPSIDAIILATPHSQHRDQIIACAGAGKHVFVEKPFTLTKADAEAAISACEEAEIVCAIGHNRRFPPAMQHLAEMALGGELGYEDGEIQARRLRRILAKKDREEGMEQLADYRKYIVATKDEPWQDPLGEPLEMLKPGGHGKSQAEAKAEALEDSEKLDEQAQREEEPEPAKRRPEKSETAAAPEASTSPHIPSALDVMRQQRAALRKREEEIARGAQSTPTGPCIERAKRSGSSFFTKVIQQKDPKRAEAHPPTPGLMQLMPLAAAAAAVGVTVEIACGAGRKVAFGPWAPRVTIGEEGP